MLIIGGILLFLIIVIVIRTITFKNKETMNKIIETNISFDIMKTAEKLSQAVKVKTISHSDYSKTDNEAFLEYQTVLKKVFPLVHTKLKKEVINDYSLLYHWEGNSKDKKPILITAHIDVVPIEKGTEEDWHYEPFSGAIEEGHVWGRGTIDTKVHMITALEAVEILLKDQYVPDRDIYFAFGHDEEVGGTEGAAKIVDHLKERGIMFEYLIDEGGCVNVGTISEIKKPIALVGIGEKGYANIKLTVTSDGGHASMPPKHTTLGIISNAIINLEKKQCKARLTQPIKEFLLKIGPEMKWTNRVILANIWLFKPIFMKLFAMSKSGNAMLRTTTAATMADGSMEPNVLPQTASATLNFRILIGETGEDLISHIKNVNKRIPLEIDILRLDNPSSISSSQAEGFKKIEEITKQLYEEVIVAPYIVLAGTDARKYEPVCENIYRFSPYKLTNEELDKIHGTNENISFENIKKCVEFFYILFKQN